MINCKGLHWDCMGLQGIWKNLMGFYGILKGCMRLHDVSRDCMILPEIAWEYKLHGISRKFKEKYEIAKDSMGDCTKLEEIARNFMRITRDFIEIECDCKRL